MQILPQSRKGTVLSILTTTVVNKLNNRIMRTILLPLLMLFACSLQANDDALAGFHCPPNAYADCHDELWDLSHFGNAYFVDYDGTHIYAGQPTVSYDLTTCNTGKIYRTWNYEDPYWNWHTCTQVIHVSGGGGFNGNSISWPTDIELTGCDVNIDPYALPYGHGHPTYPYVECSSIAYNYKDDVFYFGGDCKKIRRTWTIIDWCTYDPNNWNTGGIWTNVQIIKISNDVAPDLYCPAGVKIPSFDCDSAYVSVVPVSADYSVCGGQFQISNNSPYADSNGADASGTYPIGVHHVTFDIKYGCFTNTTCSVQIVVEDGKNPVPYCYGQLTVALMPMDDDGDGIPEDGMVSIWASDLNKDSFHPCGYGPLKFSFSPDPNDNLKTFTCAEVGKNDVAMYVTDPYGGQSFCIVEVDVQNNGANVPNCEPADDGNHTTTYNGTVSGRVLKPDYTPLPDTKITIEGAEPEIEITESLVDVEYVPVEVNSYTTPIGNTVHIMGQDTIKTYQYDTTTTTFHESIMTNFQGQFTHSNVMTNEMVKLMPEKNSCDLSRVDIDDAKVLHAFITGTISFIDPYLYLAADVDENMKVDFDDLLHLIKFVSGEVHSLPCLEPYWFVQETDNETNPFDLAIMDPLEMTLSDNATENYYLLAIMKGDLDMLIPGNQLQEILENSTLEIDFVSGIEDLEEEVNLSFSPNPTSDFANISLTGKSLDGNYQLVIFDASGKVVLQTNNKASSQKLNYSIDVSELTSGYYFYNIQGIDKAYKGSFIKN